MRRQTRETRAAETPAAAAGASLVFHSVSLTTIDQPRCEMGRLAIEMRRARIEDPGRRPGRPLLNPSLVIRRTTAPLRTSRRPLPEVRG